MIEKLREGHSLKLTFLAEVTPITFSEALRLWETDADFRRAFQRSPGQLPIYGLSLGDAGAYLEDAGLPV